MKTLIFVCCFVMNTLSIHSNVADTHIGAWLSLGSVTITKAVNNAGIEVKVPADNFKKLKITAKNAPFIITKLTVTYDTGVPQIIESHYTIAKNGESPMIDLDGTGRTIKRIDFFTENKDLAKENAEVTFFVRK